ncbi:acylphosphatase [Vreelandella alkaliphila]|uniref:Acylphosphatase n=1 Tax=Vreelandella alkaliphila TaxID=272774 RepID=A0A7C9JS97_9GAMM|nr:acylphosphatase [Halomonas alkaliphila]NDL70385.1 hypothetical protein [Halomonas alkaliphila]
MDAPNMLSKESVCFNKDAFMSYAMLGKSSLDAYLIMLAAVQKGLAVTYLGKGRFSLSDGDKKYSFIRSGEQKESKKARSICINKGDTRSCFEKDGVSCPSGFIHDKKTPITYAEAMKRIGRKKLVVKPLAESKGRGVTTEVQNDKAFEAAVSKIKSNLFLVEEQVEGEEYRCYVVGDKVVAVTGRDKPNVIGDGESNIKELVSRKNKERLKNPHLSTRKIKIDSNIKGYLKSQGLDLSSVPGDGDKIYLSTVANLSLGADSVDCFNDFPDIAKDNVVLALKSVGLNHGGVDIIVERNGAEVRSYCLEVNSRANIGSHSFPMKGGESNNLVAQEIVNFYFKGGEGFESSLYFDFSDLRKEEKNFLFSSAALSSKEYVELSEGVKVINPIFFVKVGMKIFGEFKGGAYRKWFKDFCKENEINGWVRGVSNNGVEAVVSGSKDKVQHLLDKVSYSSSLSKVESVLIGKRVRQVKPGFVTLKAK